MRRYAATLFCVVLGALLVFTPAAAADTPSVAPMIYGTLGANGWYTSDVTINWVIAPMGYTSDPGCGAATLTQDTAGQLFDCSVTWGDPYNTTIDVKRTLKVDKTPPSVSATPSRSPDANGWYNHAVTVAFSGTDGMSKVAGCTSATYAGPDDAEAAVTGTCTDNASNVGRASFALTFDATAPSVAAIPARPPDANGWYNHSITFAFSGSDATSGIAACSSATYSGPDNPDKVLTGSCTDKAGNVGSGSVRLKYDSTPPTLSKLIATPGNRSLDLSWLASPDTTVVDVSRTSSAPDVKAGLVYSGTGASFRDTRLKVGARYRYTVTAIDQAGNSVSKTIAVTATGALLQPTPAQRISRPPMLRWTRVKKAAYYNVQLVRGKKILSAWPASNHFQVPQSWVFHGHRYRLHRGVYRWYVWPGFGRLSVDRYGSVLGSSSFVVFSQR
ncbi:MAG: hypothetical protein ACXVRJ_01130 [Gaiellaceae bacterium]